MQTLAKCKCQHCSQNIEFDSDEAGATIPCPHCGMETMLYVEPVPPYQSSLEVLLRIILESYPPAEGVRMMDRYEKLRDEMWGQKVLEFEAQNPTYAAEIDKDRPILPPNEKPDGP
jgi:DNA-directed RNA polymerase subunit RPC12/RpoP